MSTVVHAGAGRRWRPTPLFAASIGLHAAAAVVALAAPSVWTWALGAIAANQALLAVVVLRPRSRLLGPNHTRLPAASIARGEVAITFDDGPDAEVTPKVLDILGAGGVRATFFCIAEHAARHPELTREIARRGHLLENHSSGHQWAFAFLGMGGIRRDLRAAQATLAELGGRTPRFFRPPMGFRSPLLDPVLHEQRLELVTWTRRGFDTRNSDAQFVAERLLRGLAAGDILLLHDGHSARTAAGTPVVLEVLPRLLEAVQREGLKPVTLQQAIAP